MLVKLFLALVVTPLAELTLLLVISKSTHWGVVVALVVLTALLGSTLARRQGWRAYQRIRAELDAGVLPTDDFLEAALIFVAGALLLLPGVLTDVGGALLLIPALRQRCRAWLTHWFRSRFVLPTLRWPGESTVVESHVVRDEGET